MKINTTISLLILVFAITACSMFSGNKDTASSNNDNKPDNSASPAKSAEKTPEFTGELKFPFDFPKAGTTAKKGEKVLVPSYNWLVDMMQKGTDKTTLIWYTQEMVEPGEEMSEVKFMGETKKVPNAYIVPIPAGQTAKKGDVLLTWWQSGSGLQRAYVTDASDPKAPTVRYLDLDYDNPAKAKDGKTSIGQMEEQLKPDSFVVIKNDLEPGTAVAIGSDMKYGQVIRAEGDKVFVTLFAGKSGVFPKSDVKAVPFKPSLKVGQKVKVVYISGFKDAEITKVDDAIGRVWTKFDSGSKEEVIAIGDVLPQ